jgi:cobalt/nickel transport system permease protein
MGAQHSHRLYVHAHTPVHALPPQCKIVALVLFVLVVVATPRTAFWAFGAYTALIGAVAAISRIPPLFIAKRLLIELPFVAFALLLPFIAQGERIDVLGIDVSRDGLLGAWNILAKATLGVLGSIILAATTEARDLLVGLERLRVPKLLVQIMSFMVRYMDVVTDELRRMRIARASRGFHARGPRHWGTVARSAGALFIRSYERGERVHLAMMSRAYAGSLPVFAGGEASVGSWVAALAVPFGALLIAVQAWVGSL